MVGLSGTGAPDGAGTDLDGMGGWAGLLSRLVSGQSLTAEEAGGALSEVLAGNASAAQIAAFVTALRIKGETVEEMAGLVEAMLRFAEPLSVSGDVVDTCGTGGDRSSSINVSTAAAFVVAGAGVPVCKHGGRGASSRCGSADVLEALGVEIGLGPAGVARCVEEAGMGFCFAPRFHPAMRHAQPVRRELGVTTVFNFLGPLANPARARRQVVGVSDPSMADKMLGVLRANGALRAMVVYGHDGLDELSTTTASTVLDLRAGEGAESEVRSYTVHPAALGLAPAALPDLVGGDAATNADLVRKVLEGGRGPHRDIVALNAAAGLVVAGRAADLPEGLARAEEVLDTGAAARVAEALAAVSRDAAREG